jgi:uncharacterized protein YeaO (DUF488 family)
MAGSIRRRRAYEPVGEGDGYRVLVDRLWPRGLSKEEAAIDRWLKDVAPSTALRKWFGHRPDRWPEFRRRYLAELAHNPAFAVLESLAAKQDLTLVYGAKDEVHNDAVVLAECLLQGAGSSRS